MDQSRIRRTGGTHRSEDQRACNNRDHQDRAKDEILADHVRHERHAGLFDLFLVLGDVRFLSHDAAGFRILVDAFGQHQPQVQTEERDDYSRYDEYVQREKPRQCLAGDDPSGQH